MRGRHPLDRPVRVAGHRRARGGTAGGSRAGAEAPPRFRGFAAGDAVHRGGRGAAVPGRGRDRGRPGVRADRLPLRAGQPGRDQGRAGQPGAARPISAACAAGRARATGAARGSTAGPRCRGCSRRPGPGPEPPGRSRGAVSAGVVVVGAGPAGLSAAAELRRLGAGPVWWRTGKPQPGGVPRHSCAHRVRAARPAPGHDRPGLRACAGVGGAGGGRGAAGGRPR